MSKPKRGDFWSRVEKTDGCWLWRGAKSSNGYGNLSRGGRWLSAHRYSWIMSNGDPGDMCVLHRCDVRLCVNPDHLFLGTKADNARDRDSKGRGRCFINARSRGKGEDNGNSRLTEQDVGAIKVQLAFGIPQQEIADCFGVTQPVISAINRGRSWSHVPCPAFSG